MAAPGKLAEVFKDTADFLVSQGLIRNVPGVEAFRKAIDSSFLERAIANAKGQ
jgi:hypothetical protein